MTADPTPSSGSRWEPGTLTAEPPPPPAAVRARITGPIVAGALGLAVLTGLGGFAIGLAVGHDGTSGVQQNSGRSFGDNGQTRGYGERRGDGRFGTQRPGGQNGSTGQGT